MFSAIGEFGARRRRLVIIGSVLFFILAAFWGTGAFGSLSAGAGFEDPNSESGRADAALAGPLGRQTADLVVLYEHPSLTVDQPEFATAVANAVATVPSGAVVSLETYWTRHDPAFVSNDRHASYVTIQLPSTNEYQRVRQFRAIEEGLTSPELQTRFGGLTAMTGQVNERNSRDIVRAEILSIPILLILMVVVFRSFVAAILPFAVALIVTAGSFVALRVFTMFTNVSAFAINIVTVLALGLAIDYGLLMVSRFREQLALGSSVDEAVRITTATAGRTILFSGLTAGASFGCLTLFPANFLSSMGYAGISVALFAVLGSLFLMPALLRIVGRKIDSLRVPLPLRSRPDATDGRWSRVARMIMRRPVVATVVIVAALLGLGAPVLSANWARPGDWVLPPTADARAVTDRLASDFEQDPARVMTVVVRTPGPSEDPATRSAMDSYASRLAEVPDIADATATGRADDLTRITLHYSIDPQSRQARAMVDGVHAVAPPDGATVLVTGMPASRFGIIEMISSRLPLMLLYIALVSFVVMFLAFGSVLLPIKAMLLNLLSLSAAFGVIKLVFQDGFLHDQLGFVPVGAVDVNFPVFIVAIAFGLAMDYEVFLLARIREHWVRTGDVETSIAVGVQQTSRIVTGAVLLMLVVIGGWVFASVTLLKMVGVGLVVAILVDATVVRGLLVPASMKLLGRWAWWAPAPLARWWERNGLREDAGPAPGPAKSEPETVAVRT
ncbi:MMPL family transporter [Nocardia mexicana]|uniref:RND superfamily putative drug exporter n=1 Tax=Nocardia mexicana TaxID=279262 RepID=A0A370GPR6_9NOCA|nr:MMPL family transporter [Nocardia mexicana]RDI45246.1 RND superfamily putative drug exporter [Nocardia mexicana]